MSGLCQSTGNPWNHLSDDCQSSASQNTILKKAFKNIRKDLADEPEMIEAKYREIQELYPQIGFSIGKTLSGLLT